MLSLSPSVTDAIAGSGSFAYVCHASPRNWKGAIKGIPRQAERIQLQQNKYQAPLAAIRFLHDLEVTRPLPLSAAK